MDFEFDVPDEDREWYEASIDRLREMLSRHYVYEEGRWREASFTEWLAWASRLHDVLVDKTVVEDAEVSTVVLPIPMFSVRLDLRAASLPLGFETMVIGGPHDGFQFRYPILADAKRGHWQIVDALREGREPDPDVGEPSVWEFLRRLLKEEGNGNAPEAADGT